MKTKQLVEIAETRAGLEKKLKERKVEYENSIAVEKAQLEDLLERESAMRAEILDTMVAQGETSIEEGDKVIVFQEKMTPQIIDPNDFLEDIAKKRDEFVKAGIEIDEMIMQSLESDVVVVADRKKALEINDIYVSLTGNSLGGMDIKKTQYLTIKNK